MTAAVVETVDQGPAGRPRPRAPVIIDLEASGLGSHSHPIEVGVALEDGERFCTLIRPAPGWDHWDEAAEQLHGLDRSMLQTHGADVGAVARRLNELLRGRVVYTDGWVVDRPWLTALFHAAGQAMEFDVSPLEAILSEAQMACWHEVKEAVTAEMAIGRHRASADAYIIQETFRRTRAAVGA